MIRVLHIVGNMNMGGQETFIMNLYRKIDRNNVQFDFVVHSEKRGYYDDEIEKLGGRIYRTTQMSKNIFKYISQLKKIIKCNNYEIIHRHTASSIVWIELLIAKMCKVKKRIVHSHSTNTNKNILLHRIFKVLLNKYSTQRLACSEDAGIWLYGENKDFIIIPNAIDIDKYTYNGKIRNEIRKNEGAENKIIIGQVGRLDHAKNHTFTLDFFYHLQENNSKYELWIIGDGELRKEIEDKIKNLNIEKKVKLFGTRNDINRLFQAIDIFVFPSLYEGLGIALIEAQISGLKCFVSKNIPIQALITDSVVQLDYNIEKWCTEIKNVEKYDRSINTQDKRVREYSIIELVQKILKIYGE